MAHPFPPGSTLQFSPPLPSPVTSPQRRARERGGFPHSVTHKPRTDTQAVARSDVGGIAYATGFAFIEPTNGALKICIIHCEIDPEFLCLRCPKNPQPRRQPAAKVRQTIALQIGCLKMQVKYKLEKQCHGNDPGSIRLFVLGQTKQHSLLVVMAHLNRRLYYSCE